MINLEKVTKKYGKFKAVDNVSMEALPGKITVLLGPNGAGKSTIIKSIANLLEFDGNIEICGYKNDTLEAKKNFGYIPEVPVLFDLLTVDEHIDFIGSAYKIDNYKDIADEYIKLFKLVKKRKSLAKELSKGMKQKLSMVLSLMIQPKALLVDEPMIGLDPASIEDTFKILHKLREDGCAILMSTHIIDMLHEWDEAYILHHGKVVHYVRREELGENTLKDIFFTYTDGE
uniref:ABC transporter ATP-binding protein n=1 Tax=Miniphocaeibacter massiliensis TaxID=2041841 RepID=UPI000C1C1F44|nr:ABC transporter ATP-binding protein [Miniphocaeibacter massiliensis]